jgi:hypothetical protein
VMFRTVPDRTIHEAGRTGFRMVRVKRLHPQLVEGPFAQSLGGVDDLAGMDRPVVGRALDEGEEGLRSPARSLTSGGGRLVARVTAPPRPPSRRGRAGDRGGERALFRELPRPVAPVVAPPAPAEEMPGGPADVKHQVAHGVG